MNKGVVYRFIEKLSEPKMSSRGLQSDVAQLANSDRLLGSRAAPVKDQAEQD